MSNVAGSKLHKAAQAIMVEDDDPKNTSELQDVKKYYESVVPMKVHEFKTRLTDLESKYGIANSSDMFTGKELQARINAIKERVISEALQVYKNLNDTEMLLLGLDIDNTGRVVLMDPTAWEQSGAKGLLDRMHNFIDKDSGKMAANAKLDIKYMKNHVKKYPGSYSFEQREFILNLDEDMYIYPNRLKAMGKNQMSPILDEFSKAIEELHNMSDIIFDMKFYEDIMSIKNDIKSRGGIIRTEFIVHHNSVNTLDGSGLLKVAGSVDVLVVFPDKSYEIYDFKTMKYAPMTNSYNYYAMVNGHPRGFGPNKQAEYAFQLLMYKRMLEESEEAIEMGLGNGNAFIVPIYTA